MKPTAVPIFAVLAFFIFLFSSCRRDVPEPVPVVKLPSIRSFSPQQGPQGAAVEISGANFTDDQTKIAVFFNGSVAEIVSSSQTKITAKVPVGATSGKITLTISGKSAESIDDFIVNESAPSINAVSPEISEAGSTIEITGANFVAGAKVYIGVLEASNVVVISSTKITATLPAGVSTAKVKVVMGSLQAESPLRLYIKPTISSVSPLVAPKETLVTVRGTNFVEGETRVKFGAVVVADNDVQIVSAAELKVKVPDGLTGTPTKVAVEIKNQEIQSAESFTLLSISSFTPTAKGGETITIAGSGFSSTANENIVKINNVAASVTAATSTSLSVVVPIGAASGLVSVNRGGYTVTNAIVFTYEYTLRVSTYAGSNMLSNPSAIAIDRFGNMYVADQYQHVIRKVSSSGAISTFAGAGTPGFANGNGSFAKFNYPTGLAVDFEGNLSVADLGNHMIRKVTRSGLVSVVAGEHGIQGSSDGTGTAAHFHSPAGLVVDHANNIYVADAGNHLVRKILPSGEVRTIAGNAGVAGASNGVGAAATFNYPSGIAVDGMGVIYVADEANHLIRKISVDGVVTTHAGAGVRGFKDGAGTSARFNYPVGLTIQAGTLYVTDAGNHLVRSISASGEVHTIAGNAGVPGNNNGTPEEASFHNPSGIALEPNGYIYVADKSNNAIRKIARQ